LPLIINNMSVRADWILLGRIVSLQVAGLSLAIKIRW
jgi:hypothetical protein